MTALRPHGERGQKPEEIFLSLKGVDQFVAGNIALARYGHFFLNLDTDQQLSVLDELWTRDQHPAARVEVTAPAIVPVVETRKQKPVQMRLF